MKKMFLFTALLVLILFSTGATCLNALQQHDRLWDHEIMLTGDPVVDSVVSTAVNVAGSFLPPWLQIGLNVLLGAGTACGVVSEKKRRKHKQERTVNGIIIERIKTKYPDLKPEILAFFAELVDETSERKSFYENHIEDTIGKDNVNNDAEN